jgi:hypothetical protein
VRLPPEKKKTCIALAGLSSSAACYPGLAPISANLSQILGSDLNIEYRTAEYRIAEVKKTSKFDIPCSTFGISLA